MMKSLLTLSSLYLLLLPLTSSAVTPDTDSTRVSLVEHLAKKQMPRSINIDLHTMASFNANFPSPTTGSDEAAFRFDHLMLGIHGNITDKLSYNYRQRLHKGTQAFETENLTNTIDYAYLQYDFSPRYSITAGRQALAVGGFEFLKYPIDVYEYSGLGGNMQAYLTGLTFTYRPTSSQEVILQVVNNRHGSTTESFGQLGVNDHNPRMPLYYSFAWNGNFADRLIEFRYGFTAGELLRGKWEYTLSGGQQLNLGCVSSYLDFIYRRADVDYPGLIRTMSRTEEGLVWDGMARSVEYLTLIWETNIRFHKKWNLQLKGVYDRGSVYEDNDQFVSGNYLSAWGYQGSLEFFPMADNNMHIYLHVGGKSFRQCRIPNMVTPEDRLRLSIGFSYRLPVL